MRPPDLRRLFAAAIVLAAWAATIVPSHAAPAGPCNWDFDPAIGMPGLASQSGGASARACAILDGDLIVGGSFITAGGVSALSAARWNGTTWSAMGGGFSSTVHSLSTFQGSLYAFGQFQLAWPNIAWRAARWDGAAWQPLGADQGLQRPGDVQNGYAYDSIVRGDSLIVGGGFTRAGDQAVGLVAAWDGSSWAPLGAGFDTLASVPGTCQWAFVPSVFALQEYQGELYAGGSFQLNAAGDSTKCIAKWDGQDWLPVGGGMEGGHGTGTADCGPPWVYDMTVWNGDLIVGGSFQQAGGESAWRVARWDGAAWHTMGTAWNTGFGGAVWSLAVTADNELIAGGWLQQSSALGLNKWQIARWNGTDWEQLGPDLTWVSTPSVYTLFPWGDDLVVGGGFTGDADGDTMNYISILRCNAPVAVDGPVPVATPGLRLTGANPFLGSTTLAFDLARDVRDARLELLDLAGRRVRTLHRGPAAAGEHALTWRGRRDDGSRVPPGVYFARFQAGDEVRVLRLVRLE